MHMSSNVPCLTFIKTVNFEIVGLYAVEQSESWFYSVISPLCDRKINFQNSYFEASLYSTVYRKRFKLENSIEY